MRFMPPWCSLLFAWRHRLPLALSARTLGVCKPSLSRGKRLWRCSKRPLRRRCGCSLFARALVTLASFVCSSLFLCLQ